MASCQTKAPQIIGITNSKESMVTGIPIICSIKKDFEKNPTMATPKKMKISKRISFFKNWNASFLFPELYFCVIIGNPATKIGA